MKLLKTNDKLMIYLFMYEGKCAVKPKIISKLMKLTMACFEIKKKINTTVEQYGMKKEKKTIKTIIKPWVHDSSLGILNRSISVRTC